MERWKINLYTVWFSQILSLTSFGFGIPFLPFYIQELGVTDPDEVKMYTGILLASTSIMIGIMGPVWGMAADRWGKKLMLLRAMFSAAFIIAGMGIATRVEHLIILRLLQGAFTGTVTAAQALIASTTPQSRLSSSIGFLSSASFIGTSLGPVLGGFAATWLGYRPSFFIGGALMLVDFFLVLIFVKEEYSVLPTAQKSDMQKNSLLSIFTFTTITMMFMLLLTRFGGSVFSPYLPLYVQEMLPGEKIVTKATGIISGIVGLMTAISALAISRLGDRYNKTGLLKILILASLVISIPLIFINNIYIFSAVYALLFLAVGGIEPTIIAISAEVTPPERRGTLFGIQTMIGSIGWVIAPVLAGYVSIKYSLNAILLLIPATMVFGCVTIYLYIRRNVPTVNVAPINKKTSL